MAFLSALPRRFPDLVLFTEELCLCCVIKKCLEESLRYNPCMWPGRLQAAGFQFAAISNKDQRGVGRV